MTVSRETTGFKRVVGKWAKDLGYTKAMMNQFDGPGGAPWGYRIANALVWSNVKYALGLDQAKVLTSSAAPISLEVSQ